MFSELLEVVYETVEFPLRVDLAPSAQRKSIEALAVSEICEYGLDNRESARVTQPTLCVASSTSGQKGLAEMRDFDLLWRSRRRSEVHEQTRTSAIYGGTEV
jgi:hypothetical protein